VHAVLAADLEGKSIIALKFTPSIYIYPRKAVVLYQKLGSRSCLRYAVMHFC
jgi:hypothetical protein